MSKHFLRSGDIAELLTHFTKLRDKARPEPDRVGFRQIQSAAA
jgi:hypothetical protein